MPNSAERSGAGMAEIEVPEQPSAPARPAGRSLGQMLVGGSSALGVATVLERGLGFLANLFAARWGGVQVFGAYAVAMTTANNVASYAGAGIGTTANRFSGEYPYGRPGYAALLRSLSVFSLGSAALAAAILWLAAAPLATHLLRNPSLTHLLRIASVSSGAIILLECLRGLLLGQRRFAALVTLSILAGGGLLAVLPEMARKGAPAMAAAQALVALSAVGVCVALAARLRFAPRGAARTGAGPGAGEVAGFGFLQLASMIGINAAGWWIASLVARADISLVQMGCYSAAMQIRNICGMPPQLISQTAYAQLTEAGGQDYGGPGRVAVVSTLAATIVSLFVGGFAAALMPYLIPHLYGKGFSGAVLAATLAAATGVMHMSAAPAGARLTIVSLPLAGTVNGIWTVLIVGLGTWLVPAGGAAEATATFLLAHLISAALVLAVLARRGELPDGLVALSAPAFAGSALLAGIGWLRATIAGSPLLNGALSFSMLAICGCLIWLSLFLGRRTGILPRSFRVSMFARDFARRASVRARGSLG